MVRLIGEKAMNTVVSHLPGVVGAVREERDEVATRAEGNLAAARASGTEKISGPEHVTRITTTDGEVDAFVNMEGTDPMAIEFGHFPSGFFDPETYGRVTKAPHGLYILTRAAGLGGATGISSGKKRGKR
jgi:hypothetical protein